MFQLSPFALSELADHEIDKLRFADKMETSSIHLRTLASVVLMKIRTACFVQQIAGFIG